MNSQKAQELTKEELEQVNGGVCIKRKSDNPKSATSL